MGRIKTTLIKRNTLKMFSLYKDKFTTDFVKNKLLVNELAEFQSKKLRNVIAGYVTRLKKQQED
jgi:small subunit ribosomal protein S17e